MREMDRNVLSAAFHVTIPVLMGYLAIGMAFGLMMDSAGYSVFWALLMSLIIYAGAGQYMGVTLLGCGGLPPSDGSDDPAAELPAHVLRPVYAGKVPGDGAAEAHI